MVSDEQGVDFDKDLARVLQIRRAHRSARPTLENPAWRNSHSDCAFLLGFIDDLWRAYSNEGRKLDATRGLLAEAVNLAAIGDIDENTEAHGWGDWMKRAKEVTR